MLRSPSLGARVEGVELAAMDEAVGRFSPDGIVICTHPEGRSAWLRQDLVARTREKYDVAVDHVVARVPSGVAR